MANTCRYPLLQLPIMSLVVLAGCCLRQVVGDQILCGQIATGKKLVTDQENLISTRIIGGRYANPGELPFQAAIYSDGGFICGGVIIGEKTILTAAHCIMGKCGKDESTPTTTMASEEELKQKLKQYTVVVGERDLEAQDNEQEFQIDRLLVHEQYCSQFPLKFADDIAILVLNKKLTWRLTQNGYGSVNRICLPHKNQDYGSTQAVYASGWGKVNPKVETSVLKVVRLKVMNRHRCNRIWSTAKGQEDQVGDGQVCTSPSNSRSTCHGDSGGPLFRKQANGERMELVGLVSFGLRDLCANKQYPNVFTMVSHYLDWIQNQLAKQPPASTTTTATTTINATSTETPSD